MCKFWQIKMFFSTKKQSLNVKYSNCLLWKCIAIVYIHCGSWGLPIIRLQQMEVITKIWTIGIEILFWSMEDLFSNQLVKKDERCQKKHRFSYFLHGVCLISWKWLMIKIFQLKIDLFRMLQKYFVACVLVYVFRIQTVKIGSLFNCKLESYQLKWKKV
jgi:hypothetical protein